jgi:hypothetical protein
MNVIEFLAVAMRRHVLMAAIATVAFVSAPDALAGGPFERIVGVGANGAWAAIKLNPTGPRSDSVLGGRHVTVPSGGYVRIYPLIGGLPGIPGRFYPAVHVLCLYWNEPVSNCSRLSAAGTELFSSLARLPLRYEAPTAPVAVRYRSRLLRYADGNIFAALELALERPGIARSSVPRDAIALAVTWRGPNVAQRPGQLYLTPIGVYTPTRLFSLQRGPWCYLAGNLRNASASLIEATARICH